MPSIWKCAPCKANGVKTDVVSGQPETGKRVKVVTAPDVEWANKTYGLSLSMPKDGNTSGGSAIPMCAEHYAGYHAAKQGFVDGVRVKSRSGEENAVGAAARKAHEAGDEAAAAAVEAQRHWTAAAWQNVTADDLRWITRAAYGARAKYADTAGLYDAILDAFVTRLATAGGTTGAFPEGAERTRILQGAAFGAQPTSKGESVTSAGTRVYGLLSLDAVSGDEDENGATLADTLADVSDEYDRQDMLALAREYADAEGEAGEAARALLAEYAVAA